MLYLGPTCPELSPLYFNHHAHRKGTVRFWLTTIDDPDTQAVSHLLSVRSPSRLTYCLDASRLLLEVDVRANMTSGGLVRHPIHRRFDPIYAVPTVLGTRSGISSIQIGDTCTSAVFSASHLGFVHARPIPPQRNPRILSIDPTKRATPQMYGASRLEPPRPREGVPLDQHKRDHPRDLRTIVPPLNSSIGN